MRFLIKTTIIILCILMLGYIFYFKKDFLKRTGNRVEKWVVNKIQSLSGANKEKEAESAAERLINKNKIEEDISEKDRKQLEKIIEEKGN